MLTTTIVAVNFTVDSVVVNAAIRIRADGASKKQTYAGQRRDE
jgi:hypothetical protein